MFNKILSAIDNFMTVHYKPILQVVLALMYIGLCILTAQRAQQPSISDKDCTMHGHAYRVEQAAMVHIQSKMAVNVFKTNPTATTVVFHDDNGTTKTYTKQILTLGK